MREFSDGQLVPGTRYRVLKLIGEGGMGSVYEVEHVELGKRFVLKALFRELAGRKDLVARLRTEWRALGRLDHPNIINVTDAGTSDNGVHFYVMERVEGETLADRMRRVGRLSIRDTLRIAAAVSEGLGAAHDIGIVHRDIKPPNIYLLQGGGVKLLDFGIAKLLDSSVEVITARGMAIGTPRYMSPEQARGDSVDGRADLYAIGLLIYEMLTGSGPFDDSADPPEMLLAHLTHQPPRISARVPEVGSELDDLVQSLLRKVPSERPSSAYQVAAILKGLGKRWQTVSTDAPTPAAHYHAVTKENGSPKPGPVAAKTAPLPGAAQPTDASPGPKAGRSELENAHTTPAQLTPSGPGSTLIIRPSGEVTESVETVRDSHSPCSADEAGAADATRATSASSDEGATSAAATTPGGPAMHEPLSSPPSVDRTLAEATSPHDGAPESERERTQEFGDLEPPLVDNSEQPTRTSVPLATMASADSAETPPPVEMMQASSGARSTRRWLSLLAVAALLSICVVVLAVVFFARAEQPQADAPVDNVPESSTLAAQSPEPEATPSPAEPEPSPATPAPPTASEPKAAAPEATPAPAAAPAKAQAKPGSDEHKAAKTPKTKEKKPSSAPAPAAKAKPAPKAVLPSSGL